MKITLLIAACALCAALPAGAQQGATVVRDKETGQLRAPTPAELKALQARNPPPPTLAPPVPRLRADGTRSVTLGERGMVYSVATRKADGSVEQQCVRGEPAATGEIHHDNP